NATTAPGYSGVPVIILDGTGGNGGNGIEITAANCEIYGLEIAHFSGRGIYIHGSTAGNFVIGAAGKGNVIRENEYYGISVDGADYGIIAYNKVGTDATGTICAGNSYDGIDFINAADHNQVLLNHVSCNGYNGIQIGGSGYNVLKGNIIGPLNNECQGNQYRGIDIEDGSQNNTVGGTSPADFNKIAGNLYYGIEVKNSSPNNLLSGNSYVCNNYGAIALNYDGNNSMVAPSITSANTSTISGTSSPNATIEVFKSQNTNPTQCTNTPSNQGADFIGITSADAGGNWILSGSFAGYIVATATDANGNTSSFGTSIYTGTTDTLINECSGYIPFITAYFNSSASTVCEKQCLNFTDQSQNAAAWKWNFESGVPESSTQQNPDNICYFTPGVFPVQLTVYDANGIDSSVAILYITVNATPSIPLISQQGDTLFSPASTGYQWFLNTIIIPGATDQQYVVTQNGFYSVEITDSVGCTAISVATYINITGIPGLENSWVEINPIQQSSDAWLTIHGMNGKTCEFSVYDLYGRALSKEKIIITSHLLNHKINLGNVPYGTYYIKLIAEGYSFTKILVLHPSR
ncbi:MAG: PKD domain-containing protein, partial [Chitinophagales bacterium]